MMMPLPLRKKLEIPLWGRCVNLIVVKSIGKELRDHFEIDDDCSGYDGLHLSDDENHPNENFILLEYPIDHGIIAHEVWHCTYGILVNRCMGTSLDCQEAYAYLAQFITDWIYKTLRRHGVKVA